MRDSLSRLALRLVGRLRDGRLEVRENGQTLIFGDESSDLRASIEIHDRAAWTQLLRGSIGFAEGYINGLWDTDDIVTVTRIAARNMEPLDRVRGRWQPILTAGQRVGRLVPRNTKRGARRNISAHYDLGNDLFGSFLDERLMYSCAYFEEEGATLEDAQLAKLDRICSRLRLDPEDHLLEIGTGWGGLAIHAASEYGCRVTTTTISREQAAYARERIAAMGLSDRIEVLESDYRDLTGTYTKLVSIEMIEAVGWQYFDTFFAKCSELLPADGLMLLQAITIDDRAYASEKASKSFANTHVFPGGCLPSLEVIARSISKRTDLRELWSEDITPHYAETLRIWRERFNAAVPELEPRGYDARFQRLWNFYLAFCEGGFRETRIGDVQLLFAKPNYREIVPAGNPGERNGANLSNVRHPSHGEGSRTFTG